MSDGNQNQIADKAGEPALKKFYITVWTSEKAVFEVMAEDHEQAEEMHENGESEEIYSSIKDSSIDVRAAEGADDEEADEDEEEHDE